MKKLIAISLFFILFISCGSEPNNKKLTYQNIIILSDMSSRIDNKKPKDIEEIDKIVKFFKNECVKPGEKIGDKSCITFSAFSEKVSASIDLSTIKNLGSKQRFINSTGEFKNTGLNQEIEDFQKKVKNNYTNLKNPGLDLISLLIEKIENENIIKENTYLTDGIDTTFVNYDNHIYIFTDGYLEYLNKNANSQFYFSEKEINKIRECSTRNKQAVTEVLKTNKSMCLPLNKSEKYKNVNIHVLETHERDKDEKKQSYNNPKGIRDNEILEAVWNKWAIESGFKSFKWKKY